MNFVILFDRKLAVFEEKYKIKSPETLRFQDFFGPSGETRTRGILVPNQAPYQLGHTRIAQTSLRNENIIHESPEKATPKTDGCRQKFGKAMEPM